MNIHHHSLHKFEDIESIEFSARNYSRLKYGSMKYAKEFGQELADSLYKSMYIDIEFSVHSSDIVVCSAPYKYLPVAATSIGDNFTPKFNLLRSELPSIKSAQNLKVSRGHSYNVDYGALDKTERERRLSTDNYHIDMESLKGKTVIFIDDVKITGSHERRMENLLERCGFDGDVIFTYYAEFTGSGHPSIENYLNYNDLHLGLQSVDNIYKTDGIRLNTRLTKYIMSHSSLELTEFIRDKPEGFLYDILVGMVGNDYHKLPEFSSNLEILKSEYGKKCGLLTF